MSEYFVGTTGTNNQTTFESLKTSEVLDDLQLNTTHSPTFNGLTVGNHIIPDADNEVDLGTTNSKDFRTLYIREIDVFNERLRIDGNGLVGRFRDHSSVGDGFQFVHLGSEILRLGNGSSEAATFAGAVTATAFHGDGSNLTGLSSSTDNTKLPLAGGNMTGHILLNNGIELRSKDNSSNIRTIARVNSGNQLEFGWSGGGPVKFMGGGSYAERMRIHTNGNVGIGTTNPAAILNVATSNDECLRFTDTATTNANDIRAYQQYYASNNTSRAGYLGFTTTNTFDIATTTASGKIRFLAGNNAQAMLIAADGNVGIGTTSPSVNFQVGDGTTDTSSRFYHNDNTYTEINGYGLYMSRGFSYIRPTTDNDKSLYIGTDDKQWLLVSQDASTHAFLTNGSESVRINSSGNVGIGTTSPAARLHVQSSGSDGIIVRTSANVEPFIALQRNTGSNGVAVLRSIDGGDLRIDTGATGAAQSTKMTVEAGGNVGIGTTNPSQPLHVLFSGDSGARIESTDNHSSLYIDSHSGKGQYIRFTENNANKYWINSSGGKLYFRPAATGTAANQVVFDSSGDVGIGTTSPDRKLHVNSGTSNANTIFESTDTAVTVRFKDSTGEAELECRNDWRFSNNAGVDERMRITSSGEVGIGTTSPSAKLELKGSTADTTANAFVARDSASASLFSIRNDGRVDATGDLVIGGNLTVNGTTSTINSTTVQVDDKNIELGTVATPTDATADGGGITLKGATDKTINWVNSTDAWTFSERVSIPVGSAASPSLTFAGDTDTGIYRIGADALGVTTGGTLRAQFNNTGIVSFLNLYSSSGGEFRNYGGTWKATTGLTGNGFQFINSVDGTALTISSTGDTVASGNVTVGGGQILTPSGTNLALNPNTGIVSVGGVIQCSGTGASTFAGDVTVNGSFKWATTGNSFIYSNDDSNGFYMERVGITDVLSDMRFQARASGAGNYSWIKIKPSNQSILLGTNGADRLTINSSGNATFAGSVTATSLDINGAATFDTNVNSGGFNTQTNSNAGSAAYVSRKWVNDTGNAEIWRNSSTRTQTGGAAQSFNIYNTQDTNLWSGGVRALHLDTSQNATFAGSVTATSLIKSGGTSSQFLKADGSVDSTTYVSSETVTSLALTSGSLVYTNESGTANSISLAAYLDEDSRSIASGSLNSGNGIVTFTRDDSTTFTLDLGDLLDDTNLVTSVAGKSGVVSLVKGDVGLGNVTNESKATMFTSPTFTGTVGGVTKAHVGLGSVTNESKATMFTNAALTGNPTATTQSSNENSTKIATTAYVKSQGYITSANGGNAGTLDGYDSTQFLRSDANDTMAGTLTFSGASSHIALQQDHVVFKRFDVTVDEGVSNSTTAYLLLCRNAPYNDVNGTVTMDRTSGLRHACSVDIVVSAGTGTNPAGTCRSIGTAGGSSPSYELVTLTYSSNSFIALKITNPDAYYETSGHYFTGRLATSDTTNAMQMIAPASVSSVSGFSSNPSHQIDGYSIFHDGYHPNADILTTTRNIALSGDVTGNVNFNGSANVSIATALAANSVGSSEIATDAVGASEIAANAVRASELSVSGNGSTSQFLRSDGDGTFTWATPTDTNTVYTHPTHAGDDINIDTGALTGATVISDLDFNVTTNSLGHVTDANGTVATRTLTAANLGISAPNAPASASAAIVGNTVEVTFAASTTSNIDAYLVYSSIDGSDYGLISIVPPDDFAASMSIIDNAFDETGTQAYRVYAMKYGILSSATTASIAYAVSSAEPTTMSVVNLNNAYYVQWNPPSANARFVTAYNVYKHEHATQGSLSRSSASLIYSGMNTNYMYQISGTNNSNFHQFWVETTIA